MDKTRQFKKIKIGLMRSEQVRWAKRNHDDGQDHNDYCHTHSVY
jgi:hypothetical protein